GAQGSELGAGCRRSGGWSLGTAGFERQNALLTASPWPQAASSAPDAELSVLAFAHPAVFAHDHRRHRLAALARRDVEALDAARQRRQREYVLQRLERFVLRGLGLVEARLIGDAGVAVGEIDHPAFFAALRHHDADAPPGPCRQPRLERLVLVRLHRDVNLRRRGSQLVELLDRGGGHLAVARAGDRLLGPELDALHHLAGADLEHLDGGAGRTELQAEDVTVPHLRGGHLLLTIVQRL